MSGPAGGGAMTIWREEEQKASTIQFGVRSPSGLDPADYPLDPGGRSSDLFPWVAVKDERNVQGATAIAVPGTVAGMELAHQHYGLLPWKELLAPAIDLARQGLLVDWYASLLICSSARSLAKDPDAAAIFLEDGQWPLVAGWTALSNRRLDQAGMAYTLSHLAEAGPRDFYDGDIAASLVKDVRDKGGCLSRDDLGTYRAHLTSTIDVRYRGGIVHAANGLTAGASLAECLGAMERAFTPGLIPDGRSLTEMARALNSACRRRLADMGDLEASHAPSCTTHFSVVDRTGNMCAVTQTLLSISALVSSRPPPAYEQRCHVVRPGTGKTQFTRSQQRMLDERLSDDWGKAWPAFRYRRVRWPQDSAGCRQPYVVHDGFRHVARGCVPPSLYRQQRRRDNHCGRGPVAGYPQSARGGGSDPHHPTDGISIRLCLSGRRHAGERHEYGLHRGHVPLGGTPCTRRAEAEMAAILTTRLHGRQPAIELAFRSQCSIRDVMFMNRDCLG